MILGQSCRVAITDSCCLPQRCSGGRPIHGGKKAVQQRYPHRSNCCFQCRIGPFPAGRYEPRPELSQARPCNQCRSALGRRVQDLGPFWRRTEAVSAVAEMRRRAQRFWAAAGSARGLGVVDLISDSSRLALLMVLIGACYSQLSRAGGGCMAMKRCRSAGSSGAGNGCLAGRPANAGWKRRVLPMSNG